MYHEHHEFQSTYFPTAKAPVVMILMGKQQYLLVHYLSRVLCVGYN
jgi:hypothetical protein